MKTYSGFTSKTADSLLLDAGAFFKNFQVGTDTFEAAVTAGKLIGATKGGGEFNAKPEVRQIEIDGVKGRAKGLETIDSWDVSLKASVIEVSKEAIMLALGASKEDESESEKYAKIVGRNNIELDDYIDNVTWIGTLSGSDEPVIIQVYNALNTEGLSFKPADKAEGVIDMTFYGHYTQVDLQTPPFAIFYPEQA